MSKALLITGATGKQGGAVIDALLNLNAQSPGGIPKYTILAVTRNTSSEASQRLLRKDASAIKLVEGNLDDIAGLFDSARETLKLTTSPSLQIHGVFSVQVSLGPGVTVQGEITQGKSLIDGAIANGVKHFVYSSVERGGDEHSWQNETPIPHFQSKYQIEHHLRDVTVIKTLASSGAGNDGQQQHMEWTILRPVAFMDNLAPGMPTKVFLAALKNHLGENEKKLQWVATHDIGVFAAKAFDSPEEWKGRAVGLAGDELDMTELDRSFARATGEPAPMGFSFLGSFLTWAVTEMGLMIGWFKDEGYKADVEARRREYPRLLTMEKWLGERSGFMRGDMD